MEANPNTEQETPKNWPKNMPFSLPAEYFSDLHTNIMQTIRLERLSDAPDSAISETSSISPLLGSLKRNGISGRWDNLKPNTNIVLSGQEETEEINLKNTPVKSLKRRMNWAAAAAIIGILILSKIFMEKQEVLHPRTETSASNGINSNSTEFSDEDIKSFLSETMALPAAPDQTTSSSNNAEPFLAYADLLGTPETFTQEMDSIPVHELIAFVNDTPAMND